MPRLNSEDNVRELSKRISKRITSSQKLLDAVALALLEETTQEVSKSICRALVVKGQVYLQGKRMTDPAYLVTEGRLLDVYFDPKNLRATSSLETPKKLRILYEDEALIFFDKPAGIPTHPTIDPKRPNAQGLAMATLKETIADPYLGLHHRLDRDTSGVLLFTRQEIYNPFVADQFSSHLCKKTYVALVHGRLKKESGRIENFLGALAKSKAKTPQKFGSIKSGGQKAISDYLVLESGKNYSLLEVSITTGRTHQIRVHLSELGHPVVGDTLYGSPEKEFQKLGRFLLHAHALSITHPETKNLLRVESPVPETFRNLL